jgi:hypothetical protein
VAFFEEQPGKAVWSEWLSHLLADGLLLVRTAPRKLGFILLLSQMLAPLVPKTPRGS